MEKHPLFNILKFNYSEKATKFCKIFNLLLTGTPYDKIKVKILENFVAFSECMNFTYRKVASINTSQLEAQFRF
jgi:hypothetical protein